MNVWHDVALIRQFEAAAREAEWGELWHAGPRTAEDHCFRWKRADDELGSGKSSEIDRHLKRISIPSAERWSSHKRKTENNSICSHSEGSPGIRCKEVIFRISLFSDCCWPLLHHFWLAISLFSSPLSCRCRRMTWRNRFALLFAFE